MHTLCAACRRIGAPHQDGGGERGKECEEDSGRGVGHEAVYEERAPTRREAGLARHPQCDQQH